MRTLISVLVLLVVTSFAPACHCQQSVVVAQPVSAFIVEPFVSTVQFAPFVRHEVVVERQQVIQKQVVQKVVVPRQVIRSRVALRRY